MDIKITRTNDPATFKMTVDITEEDIDRAFTLPDDPDEQLFLDFMGKKLLSRPGSEQLDVVSRVLARAETATALNLRAGEAEPK